LLGGSENIRASVDLVVGSGSARGMMPLTVLTFQWPQHKNRLISLRFAV